MSPPLENPEELIFLVIGIGIIIGIVIGLIFYFVSKTDKEFYEEDERESFLKNEILLILNKDIFLGRILIFVLGLALILFIYFIF